MGARFWHAHPENGLALCLLRTSLLGCVKDAPPATPLMPASVPLPAGFRHFLRVPFRLPCLLLQLERLRTVLNLSFLLLLFGRVARCFTGRFWCLESVITCQGWS